MASNVRKLEREMQEEKEEQKRLEQEKQRKMEESEKENESREKRLAEEKEKEEQKRIIEKTRKEQLKREKEMRRLAKRERTRGSLQEELFMPGEIRMKLKPITELMLGGDPELLVRNSNNSDDELNFDKKKRIRLKSALLKNETEYKEIFDILRRRDAIPHPRIQALVKNVPTNKTHVFQYQFDWNLYDKFRNDLEPTVARFVTDKVTELMGGEEQSMSDYIMEKLGDHLTPQLLYEDLHSVLDVDTEIFVLKLYRLIIFEIEKIKLALSKPK